MLRWNGKYALKTFKVKSQSNFNPDLGVFEDYTVELWGDLELRCDCVAGSYRRKCRHKRKVEEDLKREFGSLERAIEHFRELNKNKISPKITDTILNGTIGIKKN